MSNTSLTSGSGGFELSERVRTVMLYVAMYGTALAFIVP